MSALRCRYVLYLLRYHHRADQQYKKLLRMCLEGTVFKSTLPEPLDANAQSAVLKPAAKNVRTSYSISWDIVIKSIDHFLAQRGKRTMHYCTLSLTCQMMISPRRSPLL